eukprot:GFUD01073625.1.p1 GENE.GFUD01073625.1~~GFUD01073625.1.p1  ORF type:complete len:183 (-),score=51.10 GFUD01073625.1:209-757(-)
MKLLIVILAIVTCLQLANSCCCSIGLFNCGCNFFNCNCDTSNGYCMFKDCPLCTCVLVEEVCATKRRKRSVDTRLMEDYKEKYGHLIGLPELNLFYTFDTDKDGFINIREARASLNVTLDAFNEVDTDRDGFIQPAEFDSSLDNYPYANDEENENENTEMIKRLFTMMEKFTERIESYESQL